MKFRATSEVLNYISAVSVYKIQKLNVFTCELTLFRLTDYSFGTLEMGDVKFVAWKGTGQIYTFILL